MQVNGEHKIILSEVICIQKFNATSVLPNSRFSDMSKYHRVTIEIKDSKMEPWELVLGHLAKGIPGYR